MPILQSNFNYRRVNMTILESDMCKYQENDYNNNGIENQDNENAIVTTGGPAMPVQWVFICRFYIPTY